MVHTGKRIGLVGGAEIDVGTVGAFAAFKLDSQSFDAIPHVLIANHHRLFAEHRIADVVSVIADSLVAV